MGYPEALEAAGATVLSYWETGDHQGTWLAYVIYDGKEGFVEGFYGSCSGCDSFHAEFEGREFIEVGNTIWKDGRLVKAGQEDVDEYRCRLSEFGKGYLDAIATRDELMSEYRRKCSREAYYEDKKILDYLESWVMPTIN